MKSGLKLELPCGSASDRAVLGGDLELPSAPRAKALVSLGVLDLGHFLTTAGGAQLRLDLRDHIVPSHLK